jgi:glutathione S-transferase
VILIGQFDSPFVRRVAVAMHIYGFAFEHRPLSTFRDTDELARSNPLRRVPTLVLDDGEALLESAAILDHLDELAGPALALIPAKGDTRRGILRVSALACGACDKMVGLVYERLLHEVVSPQWIERCETQVGAVLDFLEGELSVRPSEFWFGDTLTHADIAIACAMRFLHEAHSESFDMSRWPALGTLAATCETLDAFKSAVQPFIAPPSR